MNIAEKKAAPRDIDELAKSLATTLIETSVAWGLNIINDLRKKKQKWCRHL